MNRNSSEDKCTFLIGAEKMLSKQQFISGIKYDASTS